MTKKLSVSLKKFGPRNIFPSPQTRRQVPSYVSFSRNWILPFPYSLLVPPRLSFASNGTRHFPHVSHYPFPFLLFLSPAINLFPCPQRNQFAVAPSSSLRRNAFRNLAIKNWRRLASGPIEFGSIYLHFSLNISNKFIWLSELLSLH